MIARASRPLRGRRCGWAGGLAAGALTAALTTRGATSDAPWAQPWQRLNHAGRPVTLIEGPALVLGAVAGLAVSGAPARDLALGVVPGVMGALDDLRGRTDIKGLRGHLRALARGEVTTGAVKIVGLGAVAAGHSVWAARERRGIRHDGRSQVGLAPPGQLASAVGDLLDLAVDTTLIAGTANLVNLFDLRPGRALKVTLALTVPTLASPAARPTAAALVGAALGALPEDLAGRAMLGDTGANPAGALAGASLAAALPRSARLLAAGALIAATVASERVSFSAVIQSHSVLRSLDAWGRRETER